METGILFLSLQVTREGRGKDKDVCSKREEKKKLSQILEVERVTQYSLRVTIYYRVMCLMLIGGELIVSKPLIIANLVKLWHHGRVVILVNMAMHGVHERIFMSCFVLFCFTPLLIHFSTRKLFLGDSPAVAFTSATPSTGTSLNGLCTMGAQHSDTKAPLFVIVLNVVKSWRSSVPLWRSHRGREEKYILFYNLL